MHFILTDKARLVCQHKTGVLLILATQNLVRIAGDFVLVGGLVKGDPEFQPIVGCPNFGMTIKPCTMSLKVKTGYSNFIHINGRPVCLDTISGLTDGTPPGVVKYEVIRPGQGFVRAQS
jgi:hypothetical protein